jgi:hypothetical protein
MKDQKSKLYSVRVPASEVEAIEGICKLFPGASPALLFRAALLSMRKTGMGNALLKHAAETARKGFNGCEE